MQRSKYTSLMLHAGTIDQNMSRQADCDLKPLPNSIILKLNPVHPEEWTEGSGKVKPKVKR